MTNSMMAYAEDLAYIHEVGYSDHVIQSTPGIQQLLAENQIPNGLVVELGCGSGRLAAALVAAGYSVLGVDLSEDLVNMARQRVPQAEFCVDSFFQMPIPPCQSVISIGECLNYCFDPSSDLWSLFERVYQALSPGGVLIFDLLEVGQIPGGTKVQSFREGTDWCVLVEKEEDPDRHRLVRRIVTFRQVGEWYRRSQETHVVQLYSAESITQWLNQVGFQVQMLAGYGDYTLRKGHQAFLARKPLSLG